MDKNKEKNELIILRHRRDATRSRESGMIENLKILAGMKPFAHENEESTIIPWEEILELAKVGTKLQDESRQAHADLMNKSRELEKSKS